MRSRLVVVRLLLMLVLAASPLVSSAIAAETGVWSQVWASPFNGRVQVAEEEEVGGHDPDVCSPSERDAVEWDADTMAVAVTAHRHAEWGERPAGPPLAGDPTPPPERV